LLLLNIIQTMDNARPFLMGKAAAMVNEKKSAKALVDELVNDPVACIHNGEGMTVTKAKL
jgi:hypothetical protein